MNQFYVGILWNVNLTWGFCKAWVWAAESWATDNISGSMLKCTVVCSRLSGIWFQIAACFRFWTERALSAFFRCWSTYHWKILGKLQANKIILCKSFNFFSWFFSFLQHSNVFYSYSLLGMLCNPYHLLNTEVATAPICSSICKHICWWWNSL